MTVRVLMVAGGVLLAAGCAEPPRPTSVQEFIDNPIKLEATMVRCSQNRSETRYETECVNARQAVSIVAAGEERARRDELERQSEEKREALRRTQEAAAEARRRAAEAERLRQEAEYLAQFGEPMPDAEQAATNEPERPDGNVPGAVVPEAGDHAQLLPAQGDIVPAADGGNAPTIEAEAGAGQQ